MFKPKKPKTLVFTRKQLKKFPTSMLLDPAVYKLLTQQPKKR